MERLLKVQTHNAVGPFQNYLEQQKIEVHPDRSDVFKADLLEQIEKRDLVKVDYEQLYWEAMPEGSRVSLNQPFPFPCSRIDSLPRRNPFFPFPYKKPKRLLFPRRKEETQKQMPNSCIVYQTQSLSRLLPTKLWRSQESPVQLLDSWMLVRPSWMRVTLQRDKLFLSANRGCATRRDV